MHSHSENGIFCKRMSFVKELEVALQSIGVHCQQYFGFGGAFIGNHVHKALKVLQL